MDSSQWDYFNFSFQDACNKVSDMMCDLIPTRLFEAPTT